MIDHLISAPSAAAMAALLAPLGLATVAEDGTISWAPNVILNIGGPNDQSIRVILQDAVWDRSDPDPRNWSVVQPAVLAEGFFLIVASDMLDARLIALSDNALRLAADREKAAAGDPDFMEFVASDMDPGVLATARVEPTALGSRYPFGNVP